MRLAKVVEQKVCVLEASDVVKLCLQMQAVNSNKVVTASQELGSEAERIHVTGNRSLMGPPVGLFCGLALQTGSS